MTDLLVPSRRGLLKAFGGIIAAPAIVRAESIMRVVVPRRRLTAEQIELLVRPPLFENELLSCFSYIDDELETAIYRGVPIRIRLPDTSWRGFSRILADAGME